MKLGISLSRKWNPEYALKFIGNKLLFKEVLPGGGAFYNEIQFFFLRSENMKNILVIVSTLMMFALGTSALAKDYGKPLQLTEKTKISTILDNPDKFIGKRVQVSGMIIEVCAKRGCWVYLSSDRPYEKIQIKVIDGEIVFPMSASGHRATVEGSVEQLAMTKEDVIRYKRHLAEEKGQPFDPSTVTGDEKIIRIHAIGAVIED